MNVQIPGILDSIQTMKDRTLKIIFRTQELSPEEAGKLHGLTHNQGWCLFSEKEMKEEDIPESEPEFNNEKTPSQRLRNVLYVYWEQQGSKGEFEAFRRQKMEDIINVFKSKLD